MFRLESPHYSQEHTTVPDVCIHAEMHKNCKFCPECGRRTDAVKRVTRDIYKDGFERKESKLFYKQFEMEQDDYNQFYIVMKYSNTDIQSIKHAVEDLEKVQQEMETLGIRGICGLISKRYYGY